MKKLLLIGLLAFTVQNSFGAIFTVSNNADAGAGSLRVAITDVNGSGDAANSIVFTISNATITLASDLPDLTNQVTMDGSGKNITIDGITANLTIGLVAGSDGSIIKGLTIANSATVGIFVNASSTNKISGNTITGSGTVGILTITSINNTLSGNTVTGSGTVGILMSTASINNAITGNTVTGSGTVGILMADASINNTLSGNTVTGSVSSGILSDMTSRSTILNTVSFNNGGNGISNTAGNGAPTPPNLTLSRTSGQTVFIQGTFTGTANNLYLVQFFKNETDNNPITEGAQFLGQQLITTDNAGNGTIFTTLPIAVAGSYVSATVTDQVGTEGTSEYSLNVLLGTESRLSGTIREKYCTAIMNSIAIL